MVDKEQIIIDGTECKNYNNGSCQEGDYPVPLANIISCDPQNIRCDFYIDKIEEQLSGKAQECEKWKHQAELGSETTDRLAKQLEEKEQQCEELKSELHLYKTWYRAKHGDIKNTLGTYYEALKDIKNITKDIIENDCYENSDTKANKILGIINKAKGIINDR